MWQRKVMSTVFACSATIHRCTAHTFSKRVSKTSKDEESWTALKDFYIYCKKNYGDTVMFGLSDY